jgi:hypothetical protein
MFESEDYVAMVSVRDNGLLEINMRLTRDVWESRLT